VVAQRPLRPAASLESGCLVPTLNLRFGEGPYSGSQVPPQARLSRGENLLTAGRVEVIS
jgi:hypothetical protein